MKKNIIIGLCLLLSIGSAKSQVTIGSHTLPNKGALLDLKQEEKTDGSANSQKGLMLPRVNLTDVDKLLPMFDGDADYIGNVANKKTDEDKKHTGLWVYHTDNCSLKGSGVYVWDGTAWQKIGEESGGGLNLSKQSLYFYSGLGNIAQDIDVSWSPTGATYTPPTYASTGITFTSSPLSGALANSPETVSFKPNDMTATELNTNLFAKKTGAINFSFANSPCATSGTTQTKTIDVTQINKGIKINGKVYPDQVEVAGTAGSTVNQTASVQSNAKWNVSILPASNPAVSNLSQTTGGSEIEDGSTNPPTQNVGYDVTVGPNKSRYSYLTFSDQQTPKRFNDVVLTVAQCNGETDLTMEQYKDLWEQMYGLDPNNDEPNSDGNTARNKNKVQWHYDQSGNIFFSGMFGTERWMLNNLAAKTYDSDVASPPTLTPNYNNSYTAAYYGYPNTNETTNAGSTTLYDKIQRLGLLYNWTAATAGKNTSTANQGEAKHAQYQGICPNGWHLPTNVEWTNLMTTLQASPTQWSSNTIGSNTVETIKDMCEPTIGIGKSFGILDGGFNAFSAGYARDGSATTYGNYGYFSSSSSYSGTNAWIRLFTVDGGPVHQGNGRRSSLFSVRCKKD